TAATVTQTKSLRRLVAQAADADCKKPAGGAVALERPSLKRPFQVLISPLHAGTSFAGTVRDRPAILVLIVDPERAPGTPETQLRRLYDLTHAEARVAREVATGEGLIAVARSLGILPSTARTHLHRVFQKTQTERQAELVKVVERIAVLRGDE